MSKTKHTPGPWRKDGRFINAKTRPDPRIAYTYADFTDCPHPEADANARLIAAAPDLLAALKWALANGMLSYNARIKGQNEAFCNGVDRIHAAIAKATEPAA